MNYISNLPSSLTEDIAAKTMAAGIMFMAPGKNVLFLQRADSGQWAFAGGHIESGETACAAAVRETFEELCCAVEERYCRPWVRTCADYGWGEVDFTTFLVEVQTAFTPVLCNEHVAYRWAPYDAPPTPLHPGCAIALARAGPDWTELHTAAAIASDQLCSPQQYENITFFLVRVTGTGGAFRHEKKDEKGNVVRAEEIVWRDPSLYLTEEFLERCKGLPVILEHPANDTLDTMEYKKRNIGSLMCPHIRNEEVWAVARVLDDGAASLMARKQLSTSPAVQWRDVEQAEEDKLSNGTKYLIETKPHLLDHLAICWQGVWDKGGEPAGIVSSDVNLTSRGDSIMPMTPEQLETFMAEQRADSAKLNKALEGFMSVLTTTTSRLDSIDKRFDAEDAKKVEAVKHAAKARVDSFEFTPRINGEADTKYKSRHDSEERILRMDMVEAGIDEAKAAADAAKKRADAEMEMADAAKKADADEKEKKEADAKAAADDAKADADEKDDKEKKEADSVTDNKVVSIADYNKLLARVDSLSKPMGDAELNKVGELQKRVDSIYIANGEKMPPLVAGDTFDIYKRKVLNDLKKYTAYKDAELSVIAIAGDSTFDAVGDQIIKEASVAARAPANMKPGQLRMLTRSDGGHTINEWAGDTTWMNQFSTPRGYVKAFNIPQSNR
jgi:8-oxo-dGTP pyrophosphatase MutT (NUDIX family)